jgi:peptidoglycan/LPS O-acetylase OafA/YrhL
MVATDATAARASKPPALPALTGLRFVAALWVVVYHYRDVIAYPPVVRQICSQGLAAVSLFFLLSGLVLAYNYLGWFRADCRRAGEFYVARFARIFPMHAVTLFLVTPVVLGALAVGSSAGAVSAPEATLSWLANLLLVHAYFPLSTLLEWNGPSWSISAEAFFYLVFPLFVRSVLGRVVQRRGIVRLLLGLGALSALTLLLSHLAFFRLVAAGIIPEPGWWYRIPALPPLRVWEFLAGCALGLLVLGDTRGTRRGTGIGRASSVVGYAALTAVLVTLAGLVWLFTQGPFGSEFAQTGSYLLYAPVFAALLLCLVWFDTGLSRALAHPMLVLLGEASYSLYLLHWIPLGLLDRAVDGPPPAWLALSVIGATILASLATYRWVELPLRRALRQAPVFRQQPGAMKPTGHAGR